MVNAEFKLFESDDLCNWGCINSFITMSEFYF